MVTCTHNSDCLGQDLLPIWPRVLRTLIVRCGHLLPIWSLVLITLTVWCRTCCQYGHVYSELWLFGARPAANMATWTHNSDCLVQDLLPIWPRVLRTLTAVRTSPASTSRGREDAPQQSKQIQPNQIFLYRGTASLLYLQITEYSWRNLSIANVRAAISRHRAVDAYGQYLTQRVVAREIQQETVAWIRTTLE